MTEREKTWSVPEVSPQFFILNPANDESGTTGALRDQGLLAKQLMMCEISWGYLRVCPGFRRLEFLRKACLLEDGVCCVT